MKNYIKLDEWKIIEESFIPENNRISESLFSIGNGYMGQRANFEEDYSGNSLRGNYFGGIYYPDKTRVGWWKNGYPEYFAKIINAINWIGIHVFIDNQPLDLAKLHIQSFKRILDMKQGILEREFVVEMPTGNSMEVKSTRFVSLTQPELGLIRYQVRPLNFDASIQLIPYLDGDVYNEDSNYDEKFWIEIDRKVQNHEGHLTLETKKTGFRVCSKMAIKAFMNEQEISPEFTTQQREKYIESSFEQHVRAKESIVLEKYTAHTSTLNHSTENLLNQANHITAKALDSGFDKLLKFHQRAWENKWETSDIRITGDVSAQQGVRFAIFQLQQSYSGGDNRLNIGPKGYTGEKYGGVTYWDTEAYCLPFYLGTAPQRVAKNLLLYRHKTLGKAIENAQKMGFENGAALFPMVTINGEECHNEWEITFEEIHRNGAIAYAIYNYVNYTGDKSYLAPYGFEVLLALSRFWAQRVNWSEEKNGYVILGVTGPNEYENNVNNNYHTNYMARWTLKYTLEVLDYLKREHAYIYEGLISRHQFNELTETSHWKDIIKKLYLPEDKARGILLQQDGFLDKEIIPASRIPHNQRPINQNWSWDRILRSPYIKQADTLQTVFWFENEFSLDDIRRNFNFYEPLTVHESSLSSCVHTILATKLGEYKKAYDLFIQSARLDLNDYNNDTEDGLHITSMGGTWMAFVMGFAGMRVENSTLHFHPHLPNTWKNYTFKLLYRGARIEIGMSDRGFQINNTSSVSIPIIVWDDEYVLQPGEKKSFVANMQLKA